MCKTNLTKKHRLLIGGIIGIVIGLILRNVFIAFNEIDNHPDKIWLHRCNSIEKLHEKSTRYPNVEVDVVFRSDYTFDVTHDVDTSFHLSIDPYLAYLQKNDGKIWLDIKNLIPANKEIMLSVLDSLLHRHGIDKNRVIIESPSWQSLDVFTRKGYYTSYYVPYEKPGKLSKDDIDRCIRLLQKIVDQNTVRALSFPGWWYDDIKEKLDRPIDLLTWKHRTTQFELLLSPKGREMLADPQLKVILIKDKGHYHR